MEEFTPKQGCISMTCKSPIQNSNVAITKTNSQEESSLPRKNNASSIQEQNKADKISSIEPQNEILGASTTASPAITAYIASAQVAYNNCPSISNMNGCVTPSGLATSHYYSPILNTPQSLLRPLMTTQPPLYSPILPQQHSYALPHPSPSSGSFANISDSFRGIEPLSCSEGVFKDVSHPPRISSDSSSEKACSALVPRNQLLDANHKRPTTQSSCSLTRFPSCSEVTTKTNDIHDQQHSFEEYIRMYGDDGSCRSWGAESGTLNHSHQGTPSLPRNNSYGTHLSGGGANVHEYSDCRLDSSWNRYISGPHSSGNSNSDSYGTDENSLNSKHLIKAFNVSSSNVNNNANAPISEHSLARAHYEYQAILTYMQSVNYLQSQDDRQECRLPDSRTSEGQCEITRNEDQSVHQVEVSKKQIDSTTSHAMNSTSPAQEISITNTSESLKQHHSSQHPTVTSLSHPLPSNSHIHSSSEEDNQPSCSFATAPPHSVPKTIQEGKESTTDPASHTNTHSSTPDCSVPAADKFVVKNSLMQDNQENFKKTEKVNSHEDPNTSFCLLCGASIGESLSHSFIDTLITVPSKISVSEKLTLMIGYPLPRELLPSMSVCPKCFHLINEVDVLEHRLKVCRREVLLSIEAMFERNGIQFSPYKKFQRQHSYAGSYQYHETQSFQHFGVNPLQAQNNTHGSYQNDTQSYGANTIYPFHNQSNQGHALHQSQMHLPQNYHQNNGHSHQTHLQMTVHRTQDHQPQLSSEHLNSHQHSDPLSQTQILNHHTVTEDHLKRHIHHHTLSKGPQESELHIDQQQRQSVARHLQHSQPVQHQNQSQSQPATQQLHQTSQAQLQTQIAQQHHLHQQTQSQVHHSQSASQQMHKTQSSQHLHQSQPHLTSQQLHHAQPPTTSQQILQPQPMLAPQDLLPQQPPPTSQQLHQPQPLPTSQQLHRLHPPPASQQVHQPQPTLSSQHVLQPQPHPASQQLHQSQPLLSSQLVLQQQLPSTSQQLHQSQATISSQHLHKPQPPATCEQLHQPEPVLSSHHVHQPQPPPTSEHLHEPQPPSTSHLLDQSQPTLSSQPSTTPNQLHQPEPTLQSQQHSHQPLPPPASKHLYLQPTHQQSPIQAFSTSQPQAVQSSSSHPQIILQPNYHSKQQSQSQHGHPQNMKLQPQPTNYTLHHYVHQQPKLPHQSQLQQLQPLSHHQQHLPELASQHRSSTHQIQSEITPLSSQTDATGSPVQVQSILSGIQSEQSKVYSNQSQGQSNPSQVQLDLSQSSLVLQSATCFQARRPHVDHLQLESVQKQLPYLVTQQQSLSSTGDNTSSIATIPKTNDNMQTDKQAVAECHQETSTSETSSKMEKLLTHSCEVEITQCIQASNPMEKDLENENAKTESEKNLPLITEHSLQLPMILSENANPLGAHPMSALGYHHSDSRKYNSELLVHRFDASYSTKTALNELESHETLPELNSSNKEFTSNASAMDSTSWNNCSNSIPKNLSCRTSTSSTNYPECDIDIEECDNLNENTPGNKVKVKCNKHSDDDDNETSAIAENESKDSECQTISDAINEQLSPVTSADSELSLLLPSHSPTPTRHLGLPEGRRNVQDTTEYHKPTLLGKNVKAKKHAKLQICRQCDQVFSNRQALIRHIERRHKSITLNHRCDTCHKKFNSERTLKQHLKTHKTYPCKICSKIFLKKTKLKKHFEEHSQQTLICKTCNKETASMQALISHIKTHEKVPKKFICPICSKNFTCKRNLNHHSLIHTGQKPYSCENCNKGFRYKSNMVNHYNICVGKFRFMCSTCGRGFALRSLYERHSAEHEGRYAHVCSICHKGFSKSHDLRIHFNSHGMAVHSCSSPCTICKIRGNGCNSNKSGDSKTICEICGKKISRKETMKDHLSFHAGKRHHACHLCSMSYFYKSNLTFHIKTVHLKILPFPCTLCRKAFSRPGNYKVHMRTHTGERPYQCKSCGKAFTSSSNYKRHQKCHITHAQVDDAKFSKEGGMLQ